jgi:hypothetical protein
MITSVAESTIIPRPIPGPSSRYDRSSMPGHSEPAIVPGLPTRDRDRWLAVWLALTALALNGLALRLGALARERGLTFSSLFGDHAHGVRDPAFPGSSFGDAGPPPMGWLSNIRPVRGGVIARLEQHARCRAPGGDHARTRGVGWRGDHAPT